MGERPSAIRGANPPLHLFWELKGSLNPLSLYETDSSSCRCHLAASSLAARNPKKLKPTNADRGRSLPLTREGSLKDGSPQRKPWPPSGAPRKSPWFWKHNASAAIRELLLLSYDFLGKETGQNFGYDRDAWNNWLWEQDYKAAPNYPYFKKRLYQRIDPNSGKYFDNNRKATIRLDEVVWGGVLQDGIPPLRNPRMISASSSQLPCRQRHRLWHRGRWRSARLPQAHSRLARNVRRYHPRSAPRGRLLNALWNCGSV